MTSFVDIKYSTQHPGVSRVESAIDAVQQLKVGFSGTRALATLLLSAVAAAVMVVAYQVMDTVAEGHLLVIWVSLWAAAFAALALFAGAARNLAARTRAALDAWSRTVAEARADQRLWTAARNDPRVMADLQAAISRTEVSAAEPVAKVAVEPAPTLSGAALGAIDRRYYI
jgi:hypothetical protein